MTILYNKFLWKWLVRSLALRDWRNVRRWFYNHTSYMDDHVYSFGPIDIVVRA